MLAGQMNTLDPLRLNTKNFELQPRKDKTMKSIKIKRKLAAAIFSGLLAFSMGSSAYAQDFHQGYPTDSKAVQKLYDEMDLQRATQGYM